MKSLLTLLILISTPTHAAGRDVGAALVAQTDAKGSLAFGVVYAYGADDAWAYQIGFSPKLTAAQGSKAYRWNFYLRSTDSFLMEWTKDHTTSINTIAIKIESQGGKRDGAIRQIINGQKRLNGQNELFLVLAADDGTILYHIAISDLCAERPDQFKDISTTGVKCSDIAL